MQYEVTSIPEKYSTLNKLIDSDSEETNPGVI